MSDQQSYTGPSLVEYSDLDECLFKESNVFSPLSSLLFDKDNPQFSLLSFKQESGSTDRYYGCQRTTYKPVEVINRATEELSKSEQKLAYLEILALYAYIDLVDFWTQSWNLDMNKDVSDKFELFYRILIISSHYCDESTQEDKKRISTILRDLNSIYQRRTDEQLYLRDVLDVLRVNRKYKENEDGISLKQRIFDDLNLLPSKVKLKDMIEHLEYDCCEGHTSPVEYIVDTNLKDTDFRGWILDPDNKHMKFVNFLCNYEGL